MASVCASTLALLDAGAPGQNAVHAAAFLPVRCLRRAVCQRLRPAHPGVPLKAHVAGVACGAVYSKDKMALLLDIKGVEDRRGNMDLKVAGTRRGVTALQLDVKPTPPGDSDDGGDAVGLDRSMLLQALELVRPPWRAALSLHANANPGPLADACAFFLSSSPPPSSCL